MSTVERDAALLEHNARLADAVLGADPGLPVAACPGWTAGDLLTHVGRGDRWAAEIVRTGAPLAFRAVPDGRPGPDPRAWLAAGPRLLLDAVAVDPERPVWTFLGTRPAVWWVRRRLHEATVHLADAVLAAGGAPELAPDVAADGVDDLLEIVTTRPDGASPLDDGSSLHLHATDHGAGEWTARAADGATTWEHGHGRGAAAVRGTASDLLLALHRRLPGDDARLQVLGDAGVWRRWLERTVF